VNSQRGQENTNAIEHRLHGVSITILLELLLKNQY
jgi:hypothetical protein